ncbi:DUF349 domain-containing protein [Thalassotalea sp. PLHSN55]|uniref:DUF349 domain-containing protein n=1 Tax=Thalassotalea sp. PLHSN55 TaxID=3435888 RepID=UPI003F8282CB
MIFSKFFKSNWQHKDASVRVLAVQNELSLDNAEQLKTLSDLLANDESDLVRRAVLIKLNNFDQWLLASKENSLEKLRNFANKKVQAILLGQDELKLNLAQQLDYLKSATDKSQLEAWLSSTDASHSELIIAMLEKLAKPQLLVSVFNQKQNSDVQRYIVEQTNDVATLERFAKKTQQADIKQLVLDKLNNLREAAEKPLKLQKTTQLTLSKLLSLKDANDYEQMLAKKEELIGQWQSAKAEFDCLSEQVQQEFLEKFDVISIQIDKAFAQKAEDFEQAKIVRELAQAKLQAQQTYTQSIAALSQKLATAIFNNETVDNDDYQQQIKQLTTAINESVLEQKDKNTFLKTLAEQSHKLTQLPMIAESVTQATHLISKISQLTVPTTVEALNDKLPSYDQWKKDWQQVEKNAAGFLPESIADAHTEITKQWQVALKPLFAEQRQLFSQTQKKINDVKRLINSGKYNAAFGVFKRVDSLFAKLDNKQQQKLQREYEGVSEKISDLSDWEHYIATPRKQQLLEEILQLVSTPLDNPKAQAAKVKEFRSTWNSLGHADDDIDKDLNHAFNEACEKAFAPCRLFYAEQEKLREQHLTTRKQVIENAKSFVQEFITNQAGLDLSQWKAIDGQLNKLQQQWKDAGEVDRQAYKDLQHEFNETLKPLKTAISQYHNDNGALKRQLIKQVTELADSEDVFSVVNQVKDLQAKWKQIGYCGPKDENKLWLSFRKINDDIFAKREQVQAIEKDTQAKLQQDFQQQLTDIQQKFDANADIKTLISLLAESDQLLSNVLQQKPILKGVVKAIESFSLSIKNAIESAKQSQVTQQWQLLFYVLETLAEDPNTEFEQLTQFNELPASWQKKLAVVAKSNKGLARADKTLELEILAGIESPNEFNEQRLAVQVNLMQNQMLSGGKVDLPALLTEWLKVGRVDNDDIHYIERIKPIFCA